MSADNGEFPFQIGINQLPVHQFVPPNGNSIDARAVAIVTSAVGVEELMLTYIVPKGKYAVIFGYGLFNDSLLESTTRFIPRLNGARTLQNHGRPIYSGFSSNPEVNYIMSLGLGPDLSNQNLVTCNILLKEGDRFTWHVINESGIANNMGVRMVGYEASGQYTGSRQGS